jgi:hypothetical protein
MLTVPENPPIALTEATSGVLAAPGITDRPDGEINRLKSGTAEIVRFRVIERVIEPLVP